MRSTPQQFERLLLHRKKVKAEKKAANKFGKHGPRGKKHKKKIKNKELEAIRHKPYSFFLETKYWKWVRRLVIKRDGNKCTKCLSKINLQVHHLSYKNHFNEHNHLEDLVTLCVTCHDNCHSIPEIAHLKAIMKEHF